MAGRGSTRVSAPTDATEETWNTRRTRRESQPLCRVVRAPGSYATTVSAKTTSPIFTLRGMPPAIPINTPSAGDRSLITAVAQAALAALPG
jgi:hypothetical protein